MDARKGNKDQFKHRRRMAWLSLATGLSYPLLVAFVPDQGAQALGMVTVPFYGLVATVVGGYFATATVEHNNERKYESQGGSNA